MDNTNSKRAPTPDSIHIRHQGVHDSSTEAGFTTELVLRGENAQQVAPDLHRFTGLKHLKVLGKGTVALLDGVAFQRSLEALCNLESFTLADCDKADTMNSLLVSLGSLHHLCELDLRGCTQDALLPLALQLQDPAFMSQLARLTVVCTTSEPSQLADALLEAIRRMPALGRLVVDTKLYHTMRIDPQNALRPHPNRLVTAILDSQSLGEIFLIDKDGDDEFRRLTEADSDTESVGASDDSTDDTVDDGPSRIVTVEDALAHNIQLTEFHRDLRNASCIALMQHCGLPASVDIGHHLAGFLWHPAIRQTMPRSAICD